MNISHLNNVTAVHKTKTRQPDSQGGYVYSFATAASYRGRLSQPTAGVRQTVLNDMGKEVGHITYDFYISPPPAAGTFKVSDRLIIGTRTFDVKVPNLTPSDPIYQKLGLLELQWPSF